MIYFVFEALLEEFVVPELDILDKSNTSDHLAELLESIDENPIYFTQFGLQQLRDFVDDETVEEEVKIKGIDYIFNNSLKDLSARFENTYMNQRLSILKAFCQNYLFDNLNEPLQKILQNDLTNITNFENLLSFYIDLDNKGLHPERCKSLKNFVHDIAYQIILDNEFIQYMRYLN